MITYGIRYKMDENNVRIDRKKHIESINKPKSNNEDRNIDELIRFKDNKTERSPETKHHYNDNFDYEMKRLNRIRNNKKVVTEKLNSYMHKISVKHYTSCIIVITHQ